MSASLAAPSTGGAASADENLAAPLPSTRVRGARGMHADVAKLHSTGVRPIVARASARGLALVDTGSGACGVCAPAASACRGRWSRIFLARASVLVAHELQRAIQRLDRGLDRPSASRRRSFSSLQS